MIYKKITEFDLNAFYPHETELYKTELTGDIGAGAYNGLKASIPGCIHNDLLAAGLIDDPIFEMNAQKCEWTENRWWVYQTLINIPKEKTANKNLRLKLCGLDYFAKIYLNGELLGEHEGMCLPFTAELNGRILTDAPNRLTVIFTEPPDEYGMFGYSSKVKTQKARFAYKWDFCPRMVQTGLYDEVLIEEFGAASIEYTQIRQKISGKSAVIECEAEINAYKSGAADVQFEIYKNNAVIASRRINVELVQRENFAEAELEIENPELWWPSGHGGAPLYELKTTVYIYDENGVVSDQKTEIFGVRTLEYMRCEGAGEDSLPYNIAVNGKRIYIKGVNFTPIDIMYGSITEEFREKIIRLAKDCNVNLIRVWGGGIIESHRFYELCSELGIMVWQEFIQSSSSIENKPSAEPHFREIARKVAKEAVKTRRNYPCLIFWCGGNELQSEYDVPATYKDETLAMLADIVKKYDGGRLMLPTSASGPREWIDIKTKGANHDVHGPWRFNGNTEHYSAFNQIDSQLHSEFGVDAMNNIYVINKILSPENQRLGPAKNNPVWRFRGWDTYYVMANLFGDFKEDELEIFTYCSQYVQYEALRYMVLANRKRAFYNCGSIIWQFSEPWPNICCTNLVDYYGCPKLGYYGVKKAFETIVPGLTYEKLVWKPNEQFLISPFAVNDLNGFKSKGILNVRVWAYNGEILLSYETEAEVRANGSSLFPENLFIIPENIAAFYIDLNLNGFVNSYLFFVGDENGFADRNIAAQEYKNQIKQT